MDGSPKIFPVKKAAMERRWTTATTASPGGGLLKKRYMHGAPSLIPLGDDDGEFRQ
jgi:hypothetical protein